MRTRIAWIAVGILIAALGILNLIVLILPTLSSFLASMLLFTMALLVLVCGISCSSFATRMQRGDTQREMAQEAIVQMAEAEPQPAVSKPELRWYQFGLRAVFVVTTLVAVLLSIARTHGFRLDGLMVAWFILLVILMVAGARACDTPRWHWGFAFCVSLAVLYVPFVIAAVNTWLADGHSTWMRVEFCKYLFVVPGGMIIEIASDLSRPLLRQHPGFSSAFG